MRKDIVSLVFYMVAAQVCFPVRHAFGSDTQKVGDKTVGRIHIEEAGTEDMLRSVAHKANVIIGFEGVWPDNKQEIVFDFAGGTVAGALNSFVAQHPEYIWKEERGVLHIFRTDTHDPLIDVLVSYPGAHDRTKLQMWMDIQERPEIRVWMKSHSCRTGEAFHPQHFKPRPQERSISIEPGVMTVAQLMDKIAAQSGMRDWAVLQSPPSASVCHVSLITW